MNEQLNAANETSTATPKRPKTMSPAAIAANRVNARKSTGPRTSSGKIKSSVNALIHAAWRLRRIASLISTYLNQALSEVTREYDRMAPMTMQNQTQTPVGAPAPQPPGQSPESFTIRPYARSERLDPSLPRLEGHETRLVALYLRIFTRLEKVIKLRNEAIQRLNPLLLVA